MNVLHRDPRSLSGSDAAAKRIAILLIALFAALLVLTWNTVQRSAGVGSRSANYPVRILLPASTQEATPDADAAQDQMPGETAPGPSLDILTTDDATNALSATSGRAAPRGPGNVLNLDYDLASLEPLRERYNRQDGSLETRMPLFVNGQSSGSAEIRIEDDARILIGAKSLSEAIGTRRSAIPTRLANALETEGGFIPFQDLRAAGVGVQYDPIKDQISLSLPS